MHMQQEHKILRVNATVEDDINLIADSIQKAENDRIILVLPEGNDVLNSPVGLKTLKRKSLTLHKAIIIIAPNEQYKNMIVDAGFMALTSQDQLAPQMWDLIQQELEDFKNTKVGLNSARQVSEKLEAELASKNADGKQVQKPVIKEQDVEIYNMPAQIEPPVILSSNDTPAETDELEPVIDHSDNPMPSYVKPPETTFQQAKQNEQAQKSSTQIKTPNSGMIGVDFSKVVSKPAPSVFDSILSLVGIRKMTTYPTPKQEGEAAIGSVVTTKSTQKSTVSKGEGNKGAGNLLKVLLFILILVGILGGGGFGIYYMYTPHIRVELKVLSDKVEIDDKFTATSSVTGFDTNKKEFQLLTEKGEQRGSVNIDTTGTGVEGTKATGVVTLSRNPATPTPSTTPTPTPAGPIVLPAGTEIVSPTGLKFITQVETTINPPPFNATVSVVAADFGTDYNLSSGTAFTVPGKPITGSNAAAFSGGTKREYKVLSKKDLDDAVNDLKKQLIDQVKSDLQFRNQSNNYVFINESFKADVDGTPIINPAVGTEATQAYLEIKVTGSASYYQKDSFQKLAESMIGTKYKTGKSVDDKTDLFFDSTTIEIKKLSLLPGDKVQMDIHASSLVTPRIDTDKLRKDIAGKKWPEMLEQVSKIPTLASTPTVRFFPSWMPDVMRYVPAEENRVEISVSVVQK